MKILVVDDSSFKRKSLKFILEKQGHEVLEAENGRDGIEKAMMHKSDAIISDILMPMMDGFQFLRNINKDKDLNSIPFIFISEIYTHDRDVRLSKMLGATGFIRLPKTPEDIWAELKGLLEGVKRGEKRVRRELVGEEEVFFSNYSNILAIKLEEKLKELERKELSLSYAERELNILREQLKQLLPSETTVFLSMNGTGKYEITFMTENVSELLGYEPSEFINNPEFMFSITHPDDIQRILTGMTKLVKQSQHSFEFRIRHKNGDYMWLHCELRLLLDSEGDPLEIIGIWIDISEHEKMQGK